MLLKKPKQSLVFSIFFIACSSTSLKEQEVESVKRTTSIV